VLAVTNWLFPRGTDIFILAGWDIRYLMAMYQLHRLYDIEEYERMITFGEIEGLGRKRSRNISK
jgi:hypothetical protein